MRLLFLIADTGGGHRASANAVAGQLNRDFPGTYEIRIVDPFAEGSPRAIGGTADLYGPITRHVRWGWGALYHATNSRAAVAALNATLLRFVRPGIVRELTESTPDAVVSFHPLLNHPMARARRRGRPDVPMVTVITDLVDVHAAWACKDVDAVVVPSPGALDRCLRAGIPAARCHDIGLPVDVSFTQPPPSRAERTALRMRLGLAPDSFVLLICGGADGSGGIARRARAVAAAGLDMELAVVCGRNERALRALEGLHDVHGRRVTVHGFVSNMADWLRASDVVATKAGPGTIAEALCCGIPLLLTSHLPGQERGNVEWVTDIGAGRYVPGVRRLLDAAAELALPGSPRLAAMREAVRGAARPDATRRIAALVDSIARRGAGPAAEVPA
ncbi:MAG: glycosyltransferase [Candidatus Dormibacteraeota bacterium]|nr:glycosyltransferase [Candidatus Dormibacteraeota bacterium]MBV9526084.1 glycosyltransferase [Candidatus Dormibacteraeota bacterium]